MVKIRALQSLASNEYGKLKTGDFGYCKPSTAKYLVEKGMAEIIQENVEPPAKEVKPFITMGNYQPKEEGKPVLYGEPSPEIKVEKKDFNPDPPDVDKIAASESKGIKDEKDLLDEIEPEQAAGKKEFTEAERAEQKKKQYK